MSRVRLPPVSTSEISAKLTLVNSNYLRTVSEAHKGALNISESAVVPPSENKVAQALMSVGHTKHLGMSKYS